MKSKMLATLGVSISVICRRIEASELKIVNEGITKQDIQNSYRWVLVKVFSTWVNSQPKAQKFVEDFDSMVGSLTKIIKEIQKNTEDYDELLGMYDLLLDDTFTDFQVMDNQIKELKSSISKDVNTLNRFNPFVYINVGIISGILAKFDLHCKHLALFKSFIDPSGGKKLELTTPLLEMLNEQNEKLVALQGKFEEWQEKKGVQKPNERIQKTKGQTQRGNSQQERLKSQYVPQLPFLQSSANLFSKNEHVKSKQQKNERTYAQWDNIAISGSSMIVGFEKDLKKLENALRRQQILPINKQDFLRRLTSLKREIVDAVDAAVCYYQESKNSGTASEQIQNELDEQYDKLLDLNDKADDLIGHFTCEKPSKESSEESSDYSGSDEYDNNFPTQKNKGMTPHISLPFLINQASSFKVSRIPFEKLVTLVADNQEAINKLEESIVTLEQEQTINVSFHQINSKVFFEKCRRLEQESDTLMKNAQIYFATSQKFLKESERTEISTNLIRQMSKLAELYKSDRIPALMKSSEVQSALDMDFVESGPDC